MSAHLGVGGGPPVSQVDSSRSIPRLTWRSRRRRRRRRVAGQEEEEVEVWEEEGQPCSNRGR